MADDYPNNSSTSGRLTVVTGSKSSTTGSLEARNDVDWFAVDVRSGYNYEFDLNAQPGFINPSTLGELLKNSSGTVLTNAGSYGYTMKVYSYRPTTTATDYLVVASSDGSGIGSYTLTASPQDDYPNNSGTNGVVATTGIPTSGALEGVNDTDWFAVTLSAGLNYRINLTATAGFVGPTNLDLTLVNVNGTVLAGTGTTDKIVSYTPTVTATYYAIVSSNGGGSIGSYSLTAATVNPVYRFFDNKFGTHFFTSDVGERNTIIATRSDLVQETNGYGGVASTDDNAVAVYRFFDTRFGTHFFTANAGERDTVIATRQDLQYESASTFYEHSTQQSGDVAVYRLFDTTTGTQFLTGDQTEYNGLTTAGSSSYRADLRSEGVAFYAPTGSFK